MKSLGTPLTRARHTLLERFFVNCLIVGFIALALLLSLSESSLVERQEGRKWRGYAAPTGMRQYWKLFAPALREHNLHYSAVVEYASGTLRLYEFPRMEKLSLTDKFVHEKQRSLFNQFLAAPDNIVFFPAVARYLARSCDSASSSDKPIKVSIFFNYVETPDLHRQWLYRDQMPEHHKRVLAFVYNVVPSDVILPQSRLNKSN